VSLVIKKSIDLSIRSESLLRSWRATWPSNKRKFGTMLYADKITSFISYL